jgi:RNA polymerase sigma-70 factor (ECF subfamily)
MLWPGNAHRLDELVTAHYACLYRYAFRLAGAAAEAEDLVQEAFCQAQQKLHQLRDWDRARPWLFSILRNGYLQRLRSARKEPTLSLDDVGEVPERASDPLPEIDPRRLQAALNDLPEPYRTPLILFYFEDFSYRDIAEHMEVPIGTVMSRLARARAYLKTRLLQPAVVGVAAHGKEEE